MAYTALARKWRPRRFDEIVGQEHVVRALTHALESDRLHHAYLFTGTRGVGKTTIARILAKAINCESRVGAEPCGVCPVCKDLDEGRFVDLVEVDAASRTKVEDTRDLLDNVQYAPSLGRYKIYLIDEVHMLSAHSFNALLKTLEEPPPHVKFLLATTDPQKIPVTVLSRCLQFNLKRLTPEEIRRQMEAILHQEMVIFEMNAVRALARSADGSLRDGLSLMDQAIAHGGGELQELTVTQMLGTVSREPIFDLLQAVIDTNAESLLQSIERLQEHAPNYGDVLQHLLVVLHHAALAQWAPDAIRSDDDAERILKISKSVNPEGLQLYYQIGLMGQKDLPLAPDSRSGFEMVMLRMLAFSPKRSRSAGAHVEPKVAPRVSTPVAPAPKLSEPPRSEASLKQSPKTQEIPAPVVTMVAPKSKSDSQDWPRLILAMGLTAMTRELANNCVLSVLDDVHCELTLDPKLTHLKSPRVEGALQNALESHFNRPIKLSISLKAPHQETPAIQKHRHEETRQQDAVSGIEEDQTVKAFKERLDARVMPGTIKPLS
jgi:DNA polymerase-3 subunit gamma/tau